MVEEKEAAKKKEITKWFSSDHFPGIYLEPVLHPDLQVPRHFPFDYVLQASKLISFGSRVFA